MVFQDPAGQIARYDQLCPHYNLVADAIYAEWRRQKAPFSLAYRPYLIAALIAFDMGRMMGAGLVQRYDSAAGGFATRLDRKLARVQPLLEPLVQHNLFEVDVSRSGRDIVRAYDVLAADGPDGLHEQGKAFHVGATKVLHFLHPELFIIVDANTARALRAAFRIPYRSSTQPGYSGERYVRSLSAVKEWIRDYGVERFRSLGPGIPVLRIFDKMAFVYGAGLATADDGGNE
jgi:hypothetical protein